MTSEHRKQYRAEYIRKHYESNKQYYLDRARARKEKIKQLIITHKSKPCIDCSIQYPYYVMQFDHLRDKKFTIASAVNRGWSEKKLLEEIAKCEVVCANCHAARTYERRS